MLSTSDAYREAIAAGAIPDLSVRLRLADGTETELSGPDLAMGGASVTSASSSSSGFDIGAAVVGTCELTLANYDGRFDDYDFTGAAVVVSMGLDLPDGTSEWLRRGTYLVEQPQSFGSTISLRCLDMLSMLMRPYSEASTIYPATLRTIVRDACTACGIPMASASFPRDEYVVECRPGGAGLTCLDVVSYAAQIACCHVGCDPWGNVRLRWYDARALSTEEGPAEGSFADLRAIRSLSTSTDDVVVTGVRVVADGGETALSGSEGYVLSIEGNPLVASGESAAVARRVADACVGMRFRPLSVSAIVSPACEAGDPMVVTDGAGRTYRSWVTRVTWRATGRSSLSCDAKSPARNSAARGNAITRALVGLQEEVRQEVVEREEAMSRLAEKLASSSGLYVTSEPQPDGSSIYYMHDKPTVAESAVVWKVTANALGLSTDGGETYPYGLDVSGAAILDRIYAVGLDADYLNAGRIAVEKNGRELLVADLDTGDVRLSDATGANRWNLATGEISISAASDPDVGGRNLALDSESMATWRRQGNWVEPSDGTAVCTAPSSASWSHAIKTPVPGVEWSEVAERRVTVGFDVRTDESWGDVGESNAVWVCFCACQSDGSRTRWRSVMVDASPDSAWRRVAVTMRMSDAALTGGGSAEIGRFLSVWVYNRSKHGVQIRHVKVERGSVPTDWTLAPEDVDRRATDLAAGKASEAEAHAKADTKAKVDAIKSRVSTLEAGFSDKQKRALDSYLTSTKVMDQLTNGGKVTGIWIKGGKLYINGTCIQTGSLKADVMRAGIIASKAAWNYYDKHRSSFGTHTFLNLDKGLLQAKGAKLIDAVIQGTATVVGGIITGTTDKLSFKDGRMTGYHGSSRTGYIAPSGMINTGQRGLMIFSPATLNIVTNKLATKKTTSDPYKQSKAMALSIGASGTVSLKNIEFRHGNATYLGGLSLTFENGLLVSASVTNILGSANLRW